MTEGDGDPGTVLGVAQRDDRRATLIAIRDRLAAELDVELLPGRDAAVIAKQLAATLREIDELPTGREESAVDDLSARRADRRAKAADQERAAGAD